MVLFTRKQVKQIREAKQEFDAMVQDFVDGGDTEQDALIQALRYNKACELEVDVCNAIEQALRKHGVETDAFCLIGDNERTYEYFQILAEVAVDKANQSKRRTA
jgi:hypothetical protein